MLHYCTLSWMEVYVSHETNTICLWWIKKKTSYILVFVICYIYFFPFGTNQKISGSTVRYLLLVKSFSKIHSFSWNEIFPSLDHLVCNYFILLKTFEFFIFVLNPFLLTIVSCSICIFSSLSSFLPNYLPSLFLYYGKGMCLPFVLISTYICSHKMCINGDHFFFRVNIQIA